MSADVVIHINESALDGLQAVLDELRALEGVEAVNPDPKHEHLVNVSFDSEIFHAKTLLGVTDKHGYHAQLIGL